MEGAGLMLDEQPPPGDVAEDEGPRRPPPWEPEFCFEDLAGVDIGSERRVDFDAVEGDLRFACKFTPFEGARHLIVSLRSAVTLSWCPPPVFFRQNWAKELGAHILAVSDPTLFMHEHIGIGCFLGTEQHDATEALVRLAESVAYSVGIPAERIVYWGGSAAGFAAGMAATFSEHGKAVVINAPHELLTVAKSRWAPVNGEVFRPEAPDFYQIVLDFPGRGSISLALDRAIEQGRRPRLLMVANVADKAFYSRWYKPFCDRYGLLEEGSTNRQGTLHSMRYDHPSGHALEPVELLPDLRARADDLFAI
jgi:hypothetical protein